METTQHILRGLLGIAVLLGLAYALSSDRKRISWRIVGTGIFLQFAVILLLQIPWNEMVFKEIAGFFVTLLGFTVKGTEFVFGPLSDPGKSGGFIFAFQVLPSIIFFSALTSLLFYWGILQRVVMVIAWIMSRVMRLSGAESLAAAANIFVGQTEAPLVVKPYIPSMTRSEIMALMVGGMATIAGAVMATYISMLGGDDPESQREFAKLLLCGSIMNAPAALYIAKIMVPETGQINRNLKVSKESVGTNTIDAVAEGTSEGLKLALNVGAMLIAFVALIAMFNHMFSVWIGERSPFGDTTINDGVKSLSGGAFSELTLSSICGFLFAPIAWAIGIEGGDTLQVGGLLGVKMIATEFIAFGDLAAMKDAGGLSERSVFMATFALCGFANFSSIGIQLGGIGSLAPTQRPALASLAFKAMLGGTLASLLSACIAGMVL